MNWHGGFYYKVVDSDDWLDPDAYKKLLARVKEFCGGGRAEFEEDIPDLFVCNYVYDHLDEGKTRSMDYRNVFRRRRCAAGIRSGTSGRRSI